MDKVEFKRVQPLSDKTKAEEKEPAKEEEKDVEHEISISFAISWKHLWNKDDSLEETSKEERVEWI